MKVERGESPVAVAVGNHCVFIVEHGIAQIVEWSLSSNCCRSDVVDRLLVVGSAVPY